MLNYKIILFALFTCTLFISIGACGDSAVEQQPLAVSAEDDGCLPEAMLNRMSFEEAEEGNIRRSLSLPGNIEVNKDRVFLVLPAAGGIITEVHVRTGDYVRRGQVLATVQSPDIATFKRDLRTVRSERNIAEQKLELARSMFESGVYSRRDLLEAESELERLQLEIERLKEEQKVLGIEEGETGYTIRAPESGFIVERNINPGTHLRSDEGHVFKISDLRNVWVVANVSETDIGNIRVGDTVAISTLAFPDKRFKGAIVRMSNTIDPGRRTMEAIIELPNPDYLLKPGMFANIRLDAMEEERFVHIPSNALIFDENEYYVVIFRDRCDMEVRHVNIQRRNGDRTYLQDGVRPGEMVVSARHILIYNQLIEAQQ
ncbi:MAG: efflux RND transporter periplasmic adaptor subunit [Saprospirales bacterium]|nr:MAG: efflux RND transporter periplasmic adaptor subunit [Saprospirales bacterium]